MGILIWRESPRNRKVSSVLDDESSGRRKDSESVDKSLRKFVVEPLGLFPSLPSPFLGIRLSPLPRERRNAMKNNLNPLLLFLSSLSSLIRRPLRTSKYDSSLGSPLSGDKSYRRRGLPRTIIKIKRHSWIPLCLLLFTFLLSFVQRFFHHTPIYTCVCVCVYTYIYASCTYTYIKIFLKDSGLRFILRYPLW